MALMLAGALIFGFGTIWGAGLVIAGEQRANRK